MNFPDLPTPNPEHQILLYRLAPVPELPLLHLLPPPLSMANVNSFKTSYIFLLQNSLYIRVHQSQDGRHVCLFYLVLWGWWFRLHAPGPGPLSGSMWLDRPFLSEQPSNLKGFCLTKSRIRILEPGRSMLESYLCQLPEGQEKLPASPANFLMAKMRRTSSTQVKP